MEYSFKENISIVVDLLKENNIKDLVISPGGTNMSIIFSVQNDSYFNCYSVVDERSAAYFAIGIFLQTGRKVALICTSAQATRNYIPGLTEAFYKRVPILAITMEKHPRFKYQEYMQAPDQTSLPHDCVKKSYELPFISDINDVHHSMRLANQAILELSKNGFGPVQLCIPWLDFPLSCVEPKRKIIKRYACDSINDQDLNGKKILLVIGEHRPFSEKEKDAITYFCRNTNTVIYTNHLSNFSNKYSLNANLLLSTVTVEEFIQLKPDILITIGGQTGDYPFYLQFSKNDIFNIEHWRVCDDGEVVDTYDKLTKIFQGGIVDFFGEIKEKSTVHEFYSSWKRELEKKDNNKTVPFSNVSIAQYLHDKMPKSSIIQFSILNCLRVWNLFELDSSIECYSNVGAFGIDGGMSTLIGQSIVSDKLSFMIIGDLAFFYDMNSLGNRHIKDNLRILLINNNGGIEFKLHGEDKNVIDNYIAAGNHYKDARGWAETCGFYYLSAKSMNEFISVSNKFLIANSKPIILEVFVSDIDESKAYISLIESNTNYTIGDVVSKGVKKSVKEVLGENNFNRLKKIIRK